MFALPVARFDGACVLRFAFLAACSRRWRSAAGRANVPNGPQWQSGAQPSRARRRPRRRVPGAVRGVGPGSRLDAINANPKKTRNIRILYAPELVHLRRGLRRRIEQRGRGRRRLHGRRERVKRIREVVARHVERVPQRFEDGELDGQ